MKPGTRTKTHRTPEGAQTARNLAVVAEFPIALHRNNVGAAVNAAGAVYKFGLGAGSSDWIGCVIGDGGPGTGRLVCIEMKAPAWHPSKDTSARWAKQKHFLEKHAEYGAISIAASDADALRQALTAALSDPGIQPVHYAIAAPGITARKRGHGPETGETENG